MTFDTKHGWVDMPNEITSKKVEDGEGEKEKNAETVIPKLPNWDSLPDQILFEIFSFLFPRSLLRAAQVFLLSKICIVYITHITNSPTHGDSPQTFECENM